jgi:putative endonuclease
MAEHIETGKLGERLAREWAVSNGYTVREQNWRYGKWEIDMIATKGNKLHFFEVKMRRNDHFGFPEALVNRNKLYHFNSAGTAYIRNHRGFRWVRYDILAITLDRHNNPTFFLIEDVYL